MRKNILITIIVAIIIASSTTKSFTHSSGPPANCVGISGNTCDQSTCHNSYKLNSGSGNVIVSVVGQTKPYKYHLDSTYIINVVVTDGKAKKYGFEAAVVDTTTSYGTIGTISTSTSNTSTISSSRYIEQNKADTTRHFKFKWKAPHSGTSTVRIFACGNAADGNGNQSGDYIYSTIDTIKYHPFSTDIYHIVLTQPTAYYFNKNLFVKLPANYSFKSMLVVYDLNGRIILSTPVNSDMQVSISQIPSGMYLAAILNETGVASTKRFIKE